MKLYVVSQSTIMNQKNLLETVMQILDDDYQTYKNQRIITLLENARNLIEKESEQCSFSYIQ